MPSIKRGGKGSVAGSARGKKKTARSAAAGATRRASTGAKKKPAPRASKASAALAKPTKRPASGRAQTRTPVRKKRAGDDDSARGVTRKPGAKPRGGATIAAPVRKAKAVRGAKAVRKPKAIKRTTTAADRERTAAAARTPGGAVTSPRATSKLSIPGGAAGRSRTRSREEALTEKARVGSEPRGARAPMVKPALRLRRGKVPTIQEPADGEVRLVGDGLNEEELIRSAKYSPRDTGDRVFEEEQFIFPDNYGVNRIRLLVKDPEWLFAYWDVDPEAVEQVKRSIGERAMALSRLTLRITDPRQGGGTDILLPAGARWWYVRAEGPGPHRSYRAELGILLPSGRFHRLAQSNTVTTPRVGPSSVRASRRVSYGQLGDLTPEDARAIREAEIEGVVSGTGPLPSNHHDGAGRPTSGEGGGVAGRGGASDTFSPGGASDVFRR